MISLNPGRMAQECNRHDKQPALRQLIAVLVNGAKNIVADWVSDVEVVVSHQSPVVVMNMVFSQAIHERQSANPGLWIHMVGKMQ